MAFSFVFWKGKYMEEYKNNSIKSKSGETKKVDKVINGTAKRKKKNEAQKFADVFISEDVNNVKSYILLDVLVPAVKKAISDIVVNGIDMILYGETGHTKKSNGTKPSYRNYYESNNTSSSTRRSIYTFDNIILSNRAEAEEVLDGMSDILNQYGTVSVADMYDLVGISGSYTDNKYGWTDIRSAEVVRERDGGYTIKLPKALPL